jgi:hypothetical protein
MREIVPRAEEEDYFQDVAGILLDDELRYGNKY